MAIDNHFVKAVPVINMNTESIQGQPMNPTGTIPSPCDTQLRGCNHPAFAANGSGIRAE
jgi:hypothetical protein